MTRFQHKTLAKQPFYTKGWSISSDRTLNDDGYPLFQEQVNLLERPGVFRQPGRERNLFPSTTVQHSCIYSISHLRAYKHCQLQLNTKMVTKIMSVVVVQSAWPTIANILCIRVYRDSFSKFEFGRHVCAQGKALPQTPFFIPPRSLRYTINNVKYTHLMIILFNAYSFKISVDFPGPAITS